MDKEKKQLLQIRIRAILIMLSTSLVIFVLASLYLWYAPPPIPRNVYIIITVVYVLANIMSAKERLWRLEMPRIKEQWLLNESENDRLLDEYYECYDKRAELIRRWADNMEEEQRKEDIKKRDALSVLIREKEEEINRMEELQNLFHAILEQHSIKKARVTAPW